MEEDGLEEEDQQVEGARAQEYGNEGRRNDES